jgi:two-component system, OmpR family, phosphate regulon sensor histidine kinase PhoR
MLTYRQKIFVAQTVLLVLFLVSLTPVIGWTVDRTLKRGLQRELQQTVSRTATTQELASKLRGPEPQYAIYDASGKLIEQSRSFPKMELGEQVRETLASGSSYSERHVPTTGREMAFVATRVQLGQNSHVAVQAVPIQAQRQVALGLEMDLVLWVALLLIVFMTCSWIVLYILSRPIHKILKAIRPFQEGRVDQIPEIPVGRKLGQDDFSRLVETINALSLRIRHQIEALRQERNDKEAILASLQEGVIAVDEQMQISYANSMAQTMLGQPDLHSRSLSAVTPPYAQLVQKALAGRQVVTDTIHLEDSQKRVFDLVAAPLADQRGAVLILQDKTAHYRMLEMGKEFVANASHELKTPITVIRGFAETLHDHPELPQERAADITAKIVRNCERMDRMVRNLLALADMERLPMSRLQESNLAEVADQCRSLILEVYPDAQVAIEQTAEDFTLMCDPDLLTQAIMNLLDNAAKYSERPAKITMRLRRTPHTLLLDVSDRGIGIPPEELTKIFQRFYTVSKQRSQILGGSGLGLSIVQTIIEKHMGHVHAESSPQGTTFTIELPTRLEEADHAES